MTIGDGAYIKKINRGLILQEIFKHQAISRADLSKITGLNKATISVQVSDLLKGELIDETEPRHSAVGRRPIMLSINSKIGYVLGIDLDYRHIQYTISDLSGHPVYSKSIDPKTENYTKVVQLLIKHIQKFQQEWSNCRYGLISAIIGIHGTVNNDEMIDFFPKYQWQHKNIKADLSQALDVEIHIENNANLSAFAEKVYKHHTSNHLLAIRLSSGIGAGMMFGGDLYKGFHGFAGEIGHMIIYPHGKRCRCGNEGCWEQYAAESNFLAALSQQFNKPNLTLQNIKQLITKENKTTMDQLKVFIHDLSIGLNNVINLYNPETLVITSEILKTYPNAVAEIEESLESSVTRYREIVISDLGNKSSVMGACALSIQRFLQVPQLMIS